MGSFANVFSLYNPHPVDPVRSLSEGMSLRNAMQLGQERRVQTDRLQLENQQLQRNQDAQRAYSEAMRQFTAQDPKTGELKTDMGGVKKYLTDRGFGPEAQQADAKNMIALENAQKYHNGQVDLFAKQAGRRGQLAGSVYQVTDPSDPAQQKLWMSSLAVAMGQAGLEGLIDPEHLQFIQQASAKGYNPEVDQLIRQYATQSLSTQQQLEAWKTKAEQNRKDLLFPYELAEQQSKTTEAGVKANTAVTQNASGALASAMAQGPNAYQQAYSQIKDASVQGRFPAPKSITDAVKAREQILNVGRTPNEIATGEETKAYRTAELEHSQERIDLLRARIAMQREKMSQDSEGSGSGPLRKGQGEQLIQNYEKLERSTNILRKSLESALATGKTYVNRNGQVVTMDTAAKGGDDDTKLALQRDMLDRYMQLTNDSSQAAADKNRIYDRMGQQVGVSTDQINGALDADRKRVQGYYDLLQQDKTFATTPAESPNTLSSTVKSGPHVSSPPTTPKPATAPPPATPSTPPPAQPAVDLPKAARDQLKEGKVTTFKNGQSWTLRNGTPIRLK